MSIDTDTITAIATPQGRGGIGILRVSGPLATSVARMLLGKLPIPRQAEYLPFCDMNGNHIDHGIALFFPGPFSFTGEDILELQGHGGPIILDLLLQQIISLQGVRIAHPGEFSKRAFINNKLDLAQAEAIADLIDASSVQAARSAFNSLQGKFSIRIHELVEMLTNLRIAVEAAIDFPDEDIDFISKSKIETSINDIITRLNMVIAEAHQGSILREGIKVVIAGKPNAGKSSLLNAIAGREVAIVTAVAGTTRDILREYIHINGIPMHIIDTAGLHESEDEVEKIGIERAWREIKQADHVLLIDSDSKEEIDSTETTLKMIQKFIARIPSGIDVTIVRNKADITGEKIGIRKIKDYSIITLSAKAGIGLNFLFEHLKQINGFTGSTEGQFLARRRHIEALKNAAKHLFQGKEQLVNACYCELLAEELRLAQKMLSEITGEFSSNDLLKNIFSSFCIGK
ncbi:tRNA modification GTPase MnmE [secondary endosymbiont of Trabutina mannipara]|uniref:tRNA modification GTPase MnmE n=1 Tax=secondary endosymbiont of Trabutina mannipara TaxID=1835721 RepID=A0A1C3L464_9ENTR|nr:tRNA uridine-5-carboxymethylaminomethyl(34) synthesis GTPase MnmE [secondary endosymbiont of Trabutina mannipara]SBT82067.1 tRNA modification GTPase MnmE [secondary endosymbiont of Trabutina mannipara]